MDQGTMYKVLTEIVNKSPAGGYLDAIKYNHYINMASRDLFRDYVSDILKNSPKRTYEDTQIITDDIRHLKQPIDLQVDTNGHGLYPDDYAMCSSIRYIATITNDCANPVVKEVRVRVLDDDKIASILTSTVMYPTLQRPYATMYDGYMQFWPNNLQVVKLTYLRLPAEIVYAVTTVNSRPVYDPNNSVQTDWPDTVQNRLIMKAAAYFGIFIREPDLVKITSEIDQSIT